MVVPHMKSLVLVGCVAVCISVGWSKPNVRPVLIFSRACLLTWLRLASRLPLGAAPSSLQTPCDVLLVGSSVAAGVGADGNGWAQLLAQEVLPRHSFVNEALAGSNTWNAPLLLTASLLRWRPKVIILSFSVGNDGLFLTFQEWQSSACADGFIRGLHRLVAQAQRSGAKVIVTSVYPHSRFTPLHLAQVVRVREEMARLHCDGFIDFFTLLDDGHSRWRKEEEADPAHPNSRGHRKMLRLARTEVQRVLARA